VAIQGGRPTDRLITAHLFVPDVDQAVAFYRDVFNALPVYRAASRRGRTIHAHLKIEGSVLELSQRPLPPGWWRKAMTWLLPQPFIIAVTLELYLADVDSCMARAMSAGAACRLPVRDMFFGDRYGQIVDPFGFVWGLATPGAVLTSQEIDERLANATQAISS
jgi:PhnB protein